MVILSSASSGRHDHSRSVSPAIRFHNRSHAWSSRSSTSLSAVRMIATLPVVRTGTDGDCGPVDRARTDRRTATGIRRIGRRPLSSRRGYPAVNAPGVVASVGCSASTWGLGAGLGPVRVVERLAVGLRGEDDVDGLFGSSFLHLRQQQRGLVLRRERGSGSSIEVRAGTGAGRRSRRRAGTAPDTARTAGPRTMVKNPHTWVVWLMV